jgi:hypothetical protein
MFAEQDGSWADPVLLLESEHGGVVDLRMGYGLNKDPTLTYPALAGAYKVLITESNNQGDASGSYFYDMLATAVKQPVKFSLSESEPNDDVGEALLVADGDRVFGEFSASLDNDWYRVIVPEGKHRVVFDIEAMQYGSAADVTATVQDIEGAEVGVYLWGDTINEQDPLVELTSAGDEVVLLNLRESSTANGRGGRPYWYVLDVSVETQ